MGPLRAGVAKSDITTEDPDANVHDPLFAKTLVLDDGETRVAIIAMDAVAIGGIGDISDDFLPRVRGRIEDELGIPGRNVLVNASHTHPPGRLLCDHEEQVARTFDAVRRAMQSMVEAQVGAGVGHEDRFIVNRTLRLRDGTGWTIRQANPCPPDDQVAGLGPIDPEIGILRIDRTDGRPLAVLYNFACHPLIGVPGGAVTANFPGFASRVIEDSLGDGAMALFLQGAGGDVTEVSYKDFDHPRDSAPLGRMLGLSTLRALSGMDTGGATLDVISETIRLPRRTDIPQRIAELEQEREELLESLVGTTLNFRSFLPLYLKYALNPEYPADYSWRYMQAEARGSDELRALDELNRRNLDRYLGNIRAMEKLARIQSNIGTLRHHQALNDAADEETIAAEVQGIRIGDCALITSPAELLVQVGLDLKRASPHRYTFVVPFSNGYIHYGAPAEDYALGGYEVTECLLAPQWHGVYMQTAKGVLQRLWDRR
ncbi:MAG: hypothetical protein ACP5KN_14285 [Armatimonadota bacterium]